MAVGVLGQVALGASAFMDCLLFFFTQKAVRAHLCSALGPQHEDVELLEPQG